MVGRPETFQLLFKSNTLIKMLSENVSGLLMHFEVCTSSLMRHFYLRTPENLFWILVLNVHQTVFFLNWGYFQKRKQFTSKQAMVCTKNINILVPGITYEAQSLSDAYSIQHFRKSLVRLSITYLEDYYCVIVQYVQYILKKQE